MLLKLTVARLLYNCDWKCEGTLPATVGHTGARAFRGWKNPRRIFRTSRQTRVVAGIVKKRSCQQRRHQDHYCRKPKATDQAGGPYRERRRRRLGCQGLRVRLGPTSDCVGRSCTAFPASVSIGSDAKALSPNAQNRIGFMRLIAYSGQYLLALLYGCRSFRMGEGFF